MTTVLDVRAEHRRDALGIGEGSPRLSWITDTDIPSWWQAAYEVEIDGAPYGRVDSDASVLVPWPTAPLASRQRASVRVRVWGADGSESAWSEPLTVEAGLLDHADWSAQWITPVEGDPPDRMAPCPLLRRAFTLPTRRVTSARLYVTSAGVHRLHLNGEVVGDHVLSPGWSTYKHRLRYDTHDVTEMVAAGDNVLGAVLADGWWRGFLTWEMTRNTYGDRLGLFAQLEVTYDDASTQIIVTDDQWRTTTGPFLSADLYQGETYDARLQLEGWDRAGFDDRSWRTVEPFNPAVGALVAPPGPPVRRIEELAVRDLIATPSGRTVLDFGQNLVGRVKFTVNGLAGTTIVLRHAEVLEGGEPAYRPLRNAEATDHYTLRGGGPETWEPEFTFHGFRYVEVEGWPGDLDPADVVAVVVHSDMERTGTFSCDHDLLNRLRENVVWGMRGNFLDVPTDCPQRDERLGWTGDLQVFAPTAAYLYDVRGVVGNWLEDLRCDQRDDGGVPMVVPSMPQPGTLSVAGWGDAVTVIPQALYTAYGDTGVLSKLLDNMCAWVDWIDRQAGPGRIWSTGMQLGDWLDPNAPPDLPFLSRTDPRLVATAYFARSAQIASDVAGVVGQPDLQQTYARLAAEVRQAFRLEYLTPKGRLMSDTAAAYALALQFGLLEDPQDCERAAAQLAFVVAEWRWVITTGFLGTPVVLPALSNSGHTATAYRLITRTKPPSWLYAVLMGATTIWERWDSMRPDGSINTGEMTSFNHYAFGSCAQWMHETIGGLAPAEPGYRRIRVAPVPGPGVTTATAGLRTPYGHAGCTWSLDGNRVTLTIDVPPNASASVVRPGMTDDIATPVTVGSGHHEWTYDVPDDIAAGWRDDTWQPAL